ncbi:MAG: zinc-binding dehydrogenase [Kiritimatiellae bacterium]|nr:zinc-binding dehydrogenase [Kiritimatiellia bacterium]
MNAKALICDNNRRFTLEDVAVPDPGPDRIVVRTSYSGVSIGTEFALIRNKISWGPFPLCTGYMGTGIVEAVGSDVSGFQVGDRVYYRGNQALAFPDGRAISSVCGTHCSRVVTTVGGTHGVALLPAAASMETASAFVMPAVGLYGTDMADPRMGQTVLVHGVGLIGLGVVAACTHRGCRVIAVDVNPRCLDMARELGADHLIDAAKQDVRSETMKLAPEGADVVFEATGLPACLDAAIALCRPCGTFVWQGNYGAAPISLNFLQAHGKRLKMVFPCDDGLQDCRRAVIKNMASGALKWEKTITHRIAFDEAPALFERIEKDDKSIIGAVIRWS